jgi:hypothetical protein
VVPHLISFTLIARLNAATSAKLRDSIHPVLFNSIARLNARPSYDPYIHSFNSDP